MRDSSAYIYLEDGTVLEGEGFGSKTIRSGELVFTTAMNGYPESLSDPSYKGEIMIITHPLIGNYGVPKKDIKEGIIGNFESGRVQVEALIISELTRSSKWNGKLDLSGWFEQEGVPGISGVDTRMLTKKVRDKGVMICAVSTKGKIADPKKALDYDFNSINFVEQVSPKKPVIHETGKKTVVVVDCGVKQGILKNIAKLGYKVVRVPYNYTADQITSLEPVGVVYSNGPGNPNLLKPVVSSMQNLLEFNIPILGICLGHQIAGLAMGGKVKKMKFGHRAVNKAVVDSASRKAYITSHNHGFAMYPDDVPKKGKIWLMSPDDNVVEGMRYEEDNMITTQFHPEGQPGTNDAGFMFNIFDRMIKNDKGSKYG